MNQSSGLSGWVGDRHAGTLAFEAQRGLFAFDYDAKWSSDPRAFALSPHLGFSRSGDETDEIHSAKVRRFFENLLPEGQALDDAARASRVSRSNLMGLLHALGRESAGAISLLPVNQSPEHLETRTRHVAVQELSRRIREREQVPFSVWDKKVRMSIAGLQDKIAVFRDPAGELFLVEGRLASTHILKPAPLGDRVPHLVANEHFCMRLASALGVPAAPAEILRVPEAVLLVERFDRSIRGTEVIKAHVVDGCQALDLPPAYKYERNLGSGRDVAHVRDGASYPGLFGLIDLTSQKAASRMMLLRWALFQYLVGNTDAHGKNISFFVHPYGLALAPAYDLVAVAAYDDFETELAMAIGDTFELEEVRAFDWADFALRCGINRRLMAREMHRMAESAQERARGLIDWEGYIADERKLLSLVMQRIDRQAQRLLRDAREVPRVKRDDL